MSRVLVTGMSGTGKSSALAELGRRGYRVVDTDGPGWREYREYVESSDDLAPRFVWSGSPPARQTERSPLEQRVLEVLDDAPAAPDRISRALGLAAGELAVTLAKLEVRGWS